MALNLQKTASAKKIDQIAAKGIEEANSKVVKDIPIDLIDPHPDNQKIYSLSGIEALMTSIEKNGFMGAIEVYAKPDGRYLIYSGHRRYTAMKQLERKTIPCLVYAMEDSYVISRKLVESNINTRVLSPIEQARQIDYYEQILNDSGYTGSISDELQRTFGMGERKIRRLRSLTKLTEQFQEWAQSPTFPYDAFYEASSFNSTWQSKLYKLIKNDLDHFPDMELSSSLVSQKIGIIKREIDREQMAKKGNSLKDIKVRELPPVYEPVRAETEETGIINEPVMTQDADAETSQELIQKTPTDIPASKDFPAPDKPDDMVSDFPEADGNDTALPYYPEMEMMSDFPETDDLEYIDETEYDPVPELIEPETDMKRVSVIIQERELNGYIRGLEQLLLDKKIFSLLSEDVKSQAYEKLNSLIKLLEN